VSAPDLRISVEGAEVVPHAIAPTLRFRLTADDASGREVYTVALSAQVHIDPAKRRYGDVEKERLVDLFGEPGRWPATTRSFLWSRVDLLVPSFRGRTEFELLVQCTYDHEVASVKYLASLDGGDVPLTFHFSGTVLYRGDEDRLQMVQMPWDDSAGYALPMATWREMIAAYYPHSGWIRLHSDTLAVLRREAAERGLPSLEACVLDLLSEREGVI
jgi:Family of unknown function (DUF6084)